MGQIVHYDNEKDMRAMVNDTIEFIMAETKRLAPQFDDKDDPNMYLMVSQNITLCLCRNIMTAMHHRNEAFMASLEKQPPGDNNHLPVNNPGFFKGGGP